MSGRFVRSSKYRHVFGTPYKKDKCYDNIRITKSPHESNMCDVNGKFVAVVLESQGGGAFMVAPLSKVGRFDLNYPKVCGHKGLVLDLAWNPFNENMIASCSEDCTIKIWEIPDEGLRENFENPSMTLEAHQRKVLQVLWHPCASDILASISVDQKLMIWNVATGDVCFELSHPDQPFSMSWNYNGSLIATTCKDKNLRVFDPRAETELQSGPCHSGSKPSRVVFCGQSNKLFTTGFTRQSDRQYALWNPKDLSRALVCEEIDTGSGVLFPFYDEGTGVVYIVGKGDTTIKYFEIAADDTVHFLTMYQSKDPQRGAGCMPKRYLDHMQCEVMRFYKLQTKGLIEPVAMTVPRKSDMFQDDIYPPCPAGEPSLTAEEWLSGDNKNPVLVTITAKGLGNKTTSTSTMLLSAPAPSKPVRVLSKQNSQGSTSSGGSTSRPRSTSPEFVASGEADPQLAKENERLRAELQQLKNENSRLAQEVKAKDDTIKRIRQLVN